LTFHAVLCALRPAFLPKGTVGRHHRAIARNGRVLLASAEPLDALAGQAVRLHLSVWRRRILPSDPLRPFGVLLRAWPCSEGPGEGPLYRAALAAEPASAALALELGGLRFLSFASVDDLPALPNNGTTAALPPRVPLTDAPDEQSEDR
jgi:hypothetical protein